MNLAVKVVLKPQYNQPTILPKLKVFTDEISNVTKTITFAFHKVENIGGKGENAGHQHFLLFPLCFLKAFFLRGIRSCHCMVKGSVTEDHS